MVCVVGKINPIELLSMDNGDSPRQGQDDGDDGDDDDDSDDFDGDDGDGDGDGDGDFDRLKYLSNNDNDDNDDETVDRSVISMDNGDSVHLNEPYKAPPACAAG